MGKRGRKSEYDIWIEDGVLEDKLILVEGWKRDGLSDEQIAHNLGINPDTVNEYKKKYPKFSEAIKKGKEVADFEVENALYKTAMEGNVTAQIFWLKNRQKEKWREKQEVQVNASPIEDLTPLAELLKGNNDKSNTDN